MKYKSLICAVVFGILLCGGANSGGDKKKPDEGKKEQSLSGVFSQMDTGGRNPPPGQPWRTTMQGGDWMQLHVVCSTNEKANELIRDLKVEIEGDAVVKMAVLTMQVRTNLSFERNGGNDVARRNLHCLVKAVKKGKATVRITPIGEDGKDRPTRVIVLEVHSNPGELPVEFGVP